MDTLYIGAGVPAICLGVVVMKLTNNYMCGLLAATAVSLMLTHITREIKNLKK